MFSSIKTNVRATNGTLNRCNRNGLSGTHRVLRYGTISRYLEIE